MTKEKEKKENFNTSCRHLTKIDIIDSSNAAAAAIAIATHDGHFRFILIT